MIRITTSVTKDPDFSGLKYFVESDSIFDADDFAEVRGLNRPELDPADVHAAQDKAAQLQDDEWLEVEFSVE